MYIYLSFIPFAEIHPMLHMLQCYMLQKISGTSNSYMLIPLITDKLNLSAINIRLRCKITRKHFLLIFNILQITNCNLAKQSSP